MEAGLFAVLHGRFIDGRPVQEVSRDEHRALSIVGNLNYLFNTRRGSLAHLPDYGLPDISEVYRDMPGSIVMLQQSIKEAVETYEPRLCRVRVEHKDTDRFAMRLVFHLSGEMIDGQRVRFQTIFSSNELAKVNPTRLLGGI